MLAFTVPGTPVAKGRVSIDRLREVFAYDADTGLLTWKVRRGTRVAPGSTAGAVNANGYLAVGVDGVRSVPVHRIAWAVTHGEWPCLEVDHINGDKQDNRLANLRLVTTAQNHENLRRARVDNRTGVLGVSKHGNRYRAQIQAQGKKRWLGEFDTIEQASAAYIEAKRQLHPMGTL